MKPSAPEFSRPIAIERIARGGSDEEISADARECAALARRLGIEAFHSLSAALRMESWRGGGIKLKGLITADVEQVSVVSLKAFRHIVELPVERFYLPPQIAVLEEDADADPIQAGHIDLGEAVAETLVLELDPYPRLPEERFELGFEPVGEKVSPFAALSMLKPGK